MNAAAPKANLPNPYYEDESNKIYCGDAFKIIPCLNDFDLVITDPPYEIDTHPPGKNKISKLEKFSSKELHDISDGFDIEGFFTMIYASFKINDLQLFNCFIFCSNKQIGKMMSYGDKFEKITNLLIWHKTNAVPFANGVWKNDLEFIVHIREKGAYFEGNSNLKSKIFTHPIIVDDRHPTVKPIPLLKKFVEIGCPPEGTVLDPFAGSGTTARACKDLGRKCISIEKSEKYCKQIVERLKQEILF